MSAPFNVGTMLLLTDGSVLAQNSGTSLWWRLRPDRAGRYAQGEWKATGASASAPLYFASAVLADGAVLIAGGEFKNNEHTASDLCTAETYDPVAETWAPLPTPAGWTAIGDAPCCVLPDGRLLIGSIDDNRCAIWDPVAKTWTATGQKQNVSSNEETWTLLRDGSVLTADCRGAPASERYYDGAWRADANTASLLVEPASNEIGPAVLLPDGTVFALGATTATGRFTPDADRSKPGVWTAGPKIPRSAAGKDQGAKDAPACLLPNGRVLCAVGPVDGKAGTYDGPTGFFEFDPSGAGGGTWSAALAQPPGDTGLPPYVFRFLLLPNGQVLASNGTPTLQVFQPDGAADMAWAPTIQACPNTLQAGAKARLQGAQLNGLSQACAYGDDAAMATNYPLVRLRAAFPSDTVVYCRTSGHSTMGVATGAQSHTTDFAVPPDAAPGVYFLSVVANGIASSEIPVTLQAATPARQRLTPFGAAGAAGAVEPEPFDEVQLFYRDLSEVHLLIDYISGRAEKSLAGLKDVATQDSAGAPVTSMSPQEVVEEICKISYPPSGSLEATAQQAAFMLVVKDRLNLLASPAKGLTVAFTSMFAGVSLDLRKTWLRDLWDFVFGGGRRKAKAKAKAAAVQSVQNPTARHSFFSAKAAYPNLEREARRFRGFYERLQWSALLLVTFIVYTSWDVSVTSAVLKRITQADRDYSAVLVDNTAAAPNEPKCADVSRATPAERSACNKYWLALHAAQAGRADLQDLVGGKAIWRPVALSVRLLGLGQPKTVASGGAAGNPKRGQAEAARAAQAEAAQAAQAEAARAASLEGLTLDAINALNSIVIPTAFGWLGTVAGLMRTISGKLRESVLAPRDFVVARLALCLGMSAGLAVGLFYSDPSAGGTTVPKAVSNTISINAAGLSFLAGFGAEAFFTFLDSILVRMFPANPPPAPFAPPAT